MQIGSGVIINSGATLGTAPPPAGNLVVNYDISNSACYSGQGIDLQNSGNFVGSPPSANVNQMFDTSADYANGFFGNVGVYNNNNNGNTIVGSDYVNHGPMSYLTFDGGANQQYVDSNMSNGYVIPSGGSYTLFSVVRVNDFGAPTNPGTWTAGIVGGNSVLFGFLPPGTGPSNYPWLMAGNNIGGGPDIYDIDTEFQVNTWYALAVTYDSASRVMKLYVNGVNTATSTGIFPFSGNEPLYWGTWEGVNWLNGDLAVMQAYTYALSPSEVLSCTSGYGNKYGIQIVEQDNDMPRQTYSKLFSVPGTYTFQAPAGVSNVSIVSVGAGGGATSSSYATPGGDTYVYSEWNNANTVFQTNYAYNNAPFITFDCSSGINATILGNVAAGWLVIGSDINNSYANRALIEGNVCGVVSSVNTTDPANVVITLNLSNVSSTSGGSYQFLGQALVGAQGGPEADDNRYNNNYPGSPGPRAVPLIGEGGMGGVINPLRSYPIGGGGAGGYGTSASVVAFDSNQTYVYDDSGDENTGTANVVLELSNNNLTVAATANNYSGYPGIATGTYGITPGQGVMFSLTVNTNAGTDNLGLGIGSYDANVKAYVGYDANSIGIFNSGNVFYNATNIGQGAVSFTTNSVVDLAVDNDNRSIWYRVNGGAWNGDANANPSLNTGGFDYNSLTSPYWNSNLYLMTTQGDATNIGQWSINTSNAFSVPSGFTFIAGLANAGSTGGDGADPKLPTYRDGQGDGATIGGSGGGGGGREYDSGSGGGGVGLYGLGNPGTHGGWVDNNQENSSTITAMAVGGRGGSRRGNSGTQGGVATAWIGGRGGWPGGGGGSAVGYWDGGNGGALAYVNNVSVSPGQTYKVIVGQGGWGGGTGNEGYTTAGVGGGGAVRIVWPGNTRMFPTTSVGIDPTGPSSITIGTTDFASWFSAGGATVINSGGYATGITMTGTTTIGNQYATLSDFTNNTLAQDLSAFFVQAGMYRVNPLTSFGYFYTPLNFNAYIFNVTWADNSTGIVRMGWLDGALLISVVNTATNDWQTSSPAQQPGPSNLTLAGTFMFPATFTPYTPLIESNGDYWC